MLDLFTCRAFEYPNGAWINPKDSRKARFDDSTHPIFRVNVPDWLAAMQEYETRDFGEEHYLPPQPPLPNPKDMTDCHGAVVWLEEIDKFRATEARLGYLFRLVNAVYEAGGLIVASANMTIAQLKEHLGEPIYRRIAGDFEPEDEAEKFQVWDLHRAAK